MTITPVYDIKALQRVWGFCIEGVEEVLRNSVKTISFPEIYNDLLAGRLLLWIGFFDKKYCGFLITQIMSVPFSGRHLHIIALYIKPEADRDVFMKGFKEISGFAEKQGCDSMRFWTKRGKGFARKLVKEGWQAGAQEFYYNLQKDGD